LDVVSRTVGHEVATDTQSHTGELHRPTQLSLTMTSTLTTSVTSIVAPTPVRPRTLLLTVQMGLEDAVATELKAALCALSDGEGDGQVHPGAGATSVRTA
jgi:hypothetical protein